MTDRPSPILAAAALVANLQGQMQGITAGMPGEPVLAAWEYGDIRVRQRPADPQGILRISLGWVASASGYAVFRGDRSKCIELLKKALKALEMGEDP